MTNQAENTDDLVINPNENDKFEVETTTNEITNDGAGNIMAEENDSEHDTKTEIELDEPEEEEQKTKKKTGILYFIIVILLVGGGAMYAYTFHRDLIAQYIPFLQSTEQAGYVAVQAETTESTTQATNEDASKGAATKTIETQETSVSDDKVADAITESITQSVQAKSEHTAVVENAKTVDAANDFKKQLQRPCWVISITSVAKESIAVARTKELRTAGNTADYYWIPDYVSGGNRYFKVFVGPFTTKADAQNYLSSHELTADAYVLKVE